MAFYRTFCALALVLLPGLLGAATNAVEGASAVTEDADAAEKDRPSTDAGFERYRTIIDRKPFGPEPANFDPDAPGSRGGAAGGGGAVDPAAQEAMKAQEEQKIIASVRVSALNVTPSGKIAVGFTDASKQPSGTYYLKVGETRDGWTVKAADARAMKVTLEKDGVEATLGLGEGSADGGKVKTVAGAAVRPPVGRLARAGLLRPVALSASAPPGASAAPGGSIASLRARRAQKEAEAEARRKAAAEQAQAEREKAAAEREKAAAEREQQLQQLQQIQEELRRNREERQQREAAQAAEAEAEQQEAQQ